MAAGDIGKARTESSGSAAEEVSVRGDVAWIEHPEAQWGPGGAAASVPPQSCFHINFHLRLFSWRCRGLHLPSVTELCKAPEPSVKSDHRGESDWQCDPPGYYGRENWRPDKDSGEGPWLIGSPHNNPVRWG